MGGFGSGRHGWKRKAEHCRSLDVNRLHREGCLRAGYLGNWVWSCDGKQTASIRMRSDAASITLSYRYTFRGAEPEIVDERIPIERTPCRYGGTRPWFRCPGIVNGRHCGRRVGKLFLNGRYFLCRHCHRLAYASQSETRLDRQFRRRDKLRLAIGAEPGCFGRIPPRPKGMWRRTYQRQRGEIFQADVRADIALEDAVERLFWRLERSRTTPR